ncbi:MAG: tetratricopeptide repeat protein [Promethearchaeota archaeon]|jgi:tetratricopeptide (TPR) repeat protein
MPNSKSYSELLQAEELISKNNKEEALNIVRKIGSKAWAYFYKGNYEEALNLTLKCKELYTKIGNKLYIALNLVLLGNLYIFTGDYNAGLIAGQKSLELYEELEYYEGIASSLCLIGVAYNYKGRFNLSIEFCEKSLSIEETDPRTKVEALYNLANVNYWKGDLDQSLKYCKRSLELTENISIGNTIGLILIQIGLVYMVKGHFDQAKEYLRRGLAISEKRELIFPLGLILEVSILRVIYSNGSLEEAEDYINRLKELAEQNPKIKLLNQQYLVGRASILLKFSSRTQDRAEAEILLKQIVKEKIYNPPTHIQAILYLCEFLIEELKISNDVKVLDELNPLVNRLLNIVEKTHSCTWQVETILIQSKLALIQMEFSKAKIYLSQAQQIAESYDLQGVAQKISKDHDHLLEQQDMWEHLKKIKAPMSERINLASFDGLLARILRIHSIEPPELVEEESILLLIMDKSGISYFNHSFLENWDFNWLFSSFMSAFDTFSSEIFSESIDRIKIGENLILIDPVESFLVCYVIKGQSYLGLQKLNRFSKAIKNDPEIWEVLKRAVKTGEVLELDKPQSLGNLVNEIFIK